MQPTQRELDQVVDRFKLKGPLTFFRRMENWIYYSENDRVYVRMVDQDHRNLEEIRSELDWMAYLAKNEVPVATPFLSKNETWVEVITHESEFQYFVSVLKEAPGESKAAKDLIVPEIQYNWGKTLARMHRLTKEYRRPSDVEPRVQWDQERSYLDIFRLGPKYDQDVFHESKKIIEKFESFPKDESCYGLIHADLHHGNFHLDSKNNLTIFDFDDTQHHWYTYDVAIPAFNLNNSLRVAPQKWSDCCDDFWKGYDTENELDDIWKDRVLDFYRYRLAVIYYFSKWQLDEVLIHSDAPDIKTVTKWLTQAVTWCRENLVGKAQL